MYVIYRLTVKIQWVFGMETLQFEADAQFNFVTLYSASQKMYKETHKSSKFFWKL